MSKTTVLRCKCTSEFQDITYGKGMRLHNITQDGKKASCTICEGSAKNAKRVSKDKKPFEAPSTNRPSKNIDNG